MRRLDIQLDEERRRLLEELGNERGVSVTETLSGLIDDAYTDFVQERRKHAAARLIELGVEIPPDPVTLSRELEAAHQPCGLPLN
ncbi:MAG: antitoxin [Chloroflexota bacterium]|nr:antitoxin [Chloroflexota bacterium]